jgi:hypothetical protein
MDKAVKKQNKKQRHEAVCVNAKRRASQTRRQEQSIGEPSSDQQSVWSDPNQYRLATYKDRSGPDQDLRRAKFGCVNSLLPVPS